MPDIRPRRKSIPLVSELVSVHFLRSFLTIQIYILNHRIMFELHIGIWSIPIYSMEKVNTHTNKHLYIDSVNFRCQIEEEKIKVQQVFSRDQIENKMKFKLTLITFYLFWLCRICFSLRNEQQQQQKNGEENK